MTLLSPNVGQQSHKSGAFDGARESPLMFTAGAGVAGVNYFGLARNKPLQEFGFFIIYVHYILRAEKALFFFHCFKMVSLPV